MRKGKKIIKVFYQSLKGNSTIEASLLMPILLTVLFLLIYLSLFLYVRAGSVRLGYIAVLRASQMEQETKNTRKAAAKREFENLKKENYLGSAMCQGEVRTDGDEIKICVKTRQSLPAEIFAGGSLYGREFLDESTFMAKTNDPVGFIRKCRKIQKGVEKWKE